MAPVVDLKCQAVAEVQVVVDEVRVADALVTDKGASDDARKFPLLSESTGRQRLTATKAAIKSRFAEILPPTLAWMWISGNESGSTPPVVSRRKPTGLVDAWLLAPGKPVVLACQVLK